jgi:hypothetical protein
LCGIAITIFNDFLHVRLQSIVVKYDQHSPRSAKLFHQRGRAKTRTIRKNSLKWCDNTDSEVVRDDFPELYFLRNQALGSSYAFLTRQMTIR